MKSLVVALSLLLFAGCQNFQLQDRYQLVSSSDGKVYRLDKKSGEIALVTPNGIRIIGAFNDPLGIRDESGKKFKVGRFEVEEVTK
jgi:hypothetical protein